MEHFKGNSCLDERELDSICTKSRYWNIFIAQLQDAAAGHKSCVVEIAAHEFPSITFWVVSAVDDLSVSALKDCLPDQNPLSIT